MKRDFAADQLDTVRPEITAFRPIPGSKPTDAFLGAVIEIVGILEEELASPLSPGFEAG
jgi:hypothetical protein